MLRALLGPASPVTVDVVPGPDLPVWTGPSDIAVVATRTGAGRYAVTPAYEAARRGVSLLGIGAEDAPLRAACSTARAPYVPLPRARVRHTTLWSLLTPLLRLAAELGLLAPRGRRPRRRSPPRWTRSPRSAGRRRSRSSTRRRPWPWSCSTRCR